MKPAQPRLPFEPLARFIGLEQSSRSLAKIVDRHDGTVRKWRIHGVPEQDADRIAVLLGVHPSAIWGDAWFAIAQQVQV